MSVFFKVGNAHEPWFTIIFEAVEVSIRSATEDQDETKRTGVCSELESKSKFSEKPQQFSTIEVYDLNSLF